MEEVTVNFLKELSKSCSFGSIHGNDCVSRIYRNIVTMLECRGYANVISKCNTVPDIFDHMKRNESVVIGQGCEFKDDVHIFFYLENKIGIKHLRAILEDADANAIICILSVDGPTTFTKKDARDHMRIIQFPTFKQLFNDLSSHHMIPSHRLLSNTEKDNMKIKYNIQNDAQLPFLLQKDPVAVFYDLRKGDVVEIKRKGFGGQEGTLYYRVVV
jgi:DNA-directed RNA polymerase subunit H (RpoH/RPB5)